MRRPPPGRRSYGAKRALPREPEVLIANATGRDHPYRAGLALHLGAVLDLPSIGVTDQQLLAEGAEAAPERGATSPLLLEGTEVARLLRTRLGARPVVVHPGWRTDVDTAVSVVLTAIRRARTPEPLWRARREARRARAACGTLLPMIRTLLHSLLYFPSRAIVQTPDRAGLDFRDLVLETDDGERLHGWWIGARTESLGHLLLCHGNAGNVGDRVLHAALLTAAGFDVLLFDYRGYGRSSGRPSEEGTYRDARAALACLLEQPKVDAARVIYLGESLGGAVAVDLALERPPAGLVLLSAFSSVRELGRLHYPFLPASLIPDAYPTVRRIHDLHAPLLVLHGDRDDIVPLSQGRALFEAAPGPKRMHVFPGVGHNDLLQLAGAEFARVIASWASGPQRPPIAH